MMDMELWLIGYLITLGHAKDEAKTWWASLSLFFLWPLYIGELLADIQHRTAEEKDDAPD